MPWVIEKQGTEWCVYLEGPDGGAVGETLGCHGSEDEAKKQQAALYAAEPDAGRTTVRVTQAHGGVERRDFALSDVQIRADAASGQPVVEGYAAVFDTLSVPLFEWELGRFREQVTRGAFAKTLREQNVPLLVQHADLPLATTGARTLRLTEDGQGLHFYSVLDAGDPDVQRLLPKMRRGDMNKGSFGFIPVRDSWDDNARPRTRTLHEVKLLDVAIVHTPAYPATDAHVRSALAATGLDAENIAELLARVRRGLTLDPGDVTLLRHLIEVCQRCITDASAPPLTALLRATTPPTTPEQTLHLGDVAQPAAASLRAPEQLLHSRAWYSEQLARMGA